MIQRELYVLLLVDVVLVEIGVNHNGAEIQMMGRGPSDLDKWQIYLLQIEFSSLRPKGRGICLV